MKNDFELASKFDLFSFFEIQKPFESLSLFDKYTEPLRWFILNFQVLDSHLIPHSY